MFTQVTVHHLEQRGGHAVAFQQATEVEDGGFVGDAI